MQSPYNSDTPYSVEGSWLGANACGKHISRCVSGSENVNTSQYIVNILKNKGKFRKNSRILIVGSNEGNLTCYLKEQGFKGEIVETDIAEKAMARAAQRYIDCGYRNIAQVRADLNKQKIKTEFDAIIAEGVLHHIENIDFCLKNLSGNLKKDGILLALEYIGPIRFQLSNLNLEWINAALACVPMNLRPFCPEGLEIYPANNEFRSKVYYVVGDEEVIKSTDISEACIGETLDDSLLTYFKCIERKGFGGTLLSYMTGHFNFELANSSRYAERWLEFLIEIESNLVKSQILPDHFVFYYLRKKGFSNGLWFEFVVLLRKKLASIRRYRRLAFETKSFVRRFTEVLKSN